MAFMNNVNEPELDIPDAKLDKLYADNLARAEILSKQLIEKHL